MAEDERIYKEDEIAAEFGRAYDHVKIEKGYADDANNVGANRHITNWYLTRQTEPNILDADSSDDMASTEHDPVAEKARALSIHRRVPLPLKTQSLHGYVLYGELEPSTNEEGSARNGQTIKVMLSKPSTWVFDRTKSNRGIWVTTGMSKGWYWLKKPNDDPVPLDAIITIKNSTKKGGKDEPDSPKRRAHLPSQETVHLPLRARLGLLSNLVDLLSEPYGGGDGKDDTEEDVTHNYVPIHAKRTPEAIHALLSPSAEILVEHNTPENPLNSEPFDLDLLKQCPGFVRHHLDAMHSLLDAESVFMSELTKMEQARKDAGLDRPAKSTGGDDDVGWSDEEYRSSAEAAERRGRRMPWGELISAEEGKKVRPNRLIDIEIQRAAKMATEEAANEDAADVQGQEKEEEEDYGDDDSDEEDDVGAQPWRKKAKPKRVVDDEDEDDEDNKVDNDSTNNKAKKKKKKKNLSYDESLREKQQDTDAATDGEAEAAGVAPGFDPLSYLAVKPEADFSPQAMASAVKELSKYLTPEPSGVDLDADTYSDDDSHVPTNFSVSDDNAASFNEVFVQQSNIPSLESILLATEAIRRSSKKVMKSMFKASKVHSVVPGKVLFDKWLDTAILLVGRSKTCSALIISSIMNLICDFNVIKDAKQVGLLKSKFSVDWVASIAKARACAEKHELTDVAEACSKAQQHVDALVKGAPAAAPAKREAEAASTNGAAAAAAVAAVAAVAKPAVNAEALEKEKKVKEEKERLRRQRMAQMLKKAQISYGTGGAAGDKPPDTVKVSAAAPAVKTEDKRASPAPPRTSGWGSKDRSSKDDSSSGGWGSSAGRESASKSSAWGTPQRSSDRGGGGWGGGSRSEPFASRDGGGWGSRPSRESTPPRDSGWGSSRRETTPPPKSSGWDSQPPPSDRPDSRDGPRSSGGWGSHPPSDRPDARGGSRSSGGGWGSQPSGRPDSRNGPRPGGGWGSSAPSDSRDAPRRDQWGDSGPRDAPRRDKWGDSGPPLDAPRRDSGPRDAPRRDKWGDSGPPLDAPRRDSGPRDAPRRDRWGESSRGGGYERDSGPPHSGSQKREREEGGWEGVQDRPPYREPRRTEDDTKRRRFDSKPSVPAQAPPPAAAAPPMGRGRGRGAGRGKDANLPAWMTRGDAPAPLAAAPAEPQAAAPSPIPPSVAVVTAPIPPPAAAPVPAPVAPPAAPSMGRGRGRGAGRGREANLPAWMTRGEAVAPPQAAAPPPAPAAAAATAASVTPGLNIDVNAIADAVAMATAASTNPAASGNLPSAPANPAPTEKEGKYGAGTTVQGSDLDQKAAFNPYVAEQGGGRGGGGGFGGRGRNGGGRFGDRRGPSPPPPLSAAPAGPGMGRGRGRGRGKDVNKPAWMTKQESGELR